MTDRKIILDTETTGLYAKSGDKIVEIACIELLNDRDLGEVFHYYLNPQREIPHEAIRVHGITNEKVKDSPIFNQIAGDFLKFIGNSHIIAHNASFDMGFINEELKNANFAIIENERFIDTLAIARKKFSSNRNNTLDDLCKRFNISLESRKDFHGALIDVELLSKVYYHLISGQNSIFENETKLQKNENLFHSNIKNTIKYNSEYFPYKKPILSEENIEKHRETLLKLKNTIWRE